ncbi:MAG TPA: hypothetical protein VGF75_00095 [Candidatus Saccharimonadales bacterium]|jgi:hypothetical protein
MKPINPTVSQINTPAGILRWAQSIFDTLVNKTALAEGNLQDSTGIYTTFNTDNGNGIMFRVGANGSGLTYAWDSSGQVTINHALKRPPIGFIICDLDGNATIWRYQVPTQDIMQLQTSDNTVNITVYIF